MQRGNNHAIGILALDQASNCGWALQTKDTNTHSGVKGFFLDRGESPGMRFLRFRAWLNQMYKLANGGIDVIIYEAPHHRGGHSTQVAYGFITEILSFAADHGVETMKPVHTGTLKKFATGKGNASKEEMIIAARKRGWEIEDGNDDEADAVLMLEYAKRKLSGN